MKKKTYAIVPIIFFSLMMVLTFFSRTIYRSILPNVDVTSPRGGNLRFVYTTHDYNLSGADASVIYLPFVLSEALYIDKVYVRENDLVLEGEPLFRFYEPQAKEVLSEIRHKREETGVKWRIWKEKYTLALEAAEAKIKNGGPDSEIRTAMSELTLLHEGIMNDTSLELVYNEYNSYCILVDTLTNLEKANWTLFAPHHGLVGEITLNIGDSYYGIKPMLEIFSIESQPTILVEWLSFPKQYSSNWVMTSTITDKHGRVDCTPLYMNKLAAGSVKVYVQPNGSCDYSSISQITIMLQTPYQPVMIPNKVLNGSDCFLLAQRIGAWGLTEYYAKKVSLSLGASDGSYTSILSGLSINDTLIDTSSTPIEDGQTVVIRQQ